MEKQEYIRIWIDSALKKTKNINLKDSTSYGLKHICESSLGVYVSNLEIKTAMNEKGYKSYSKSFSDLNESYNISIVINKVVFRNKLGTQYDLEQRTFHRRAKEIYIE
jgi:phage FluMu gp28-like protein